MNVIMTQMIVFIIIIILILVIITLIAITLSDPEGPNSLSGRLGFETDIIELQH